MDAMQHRQDDHRSFPVATAKLNGNMAAADKAALESLVEVVAALRKQVADLEAQINALP